ncbi:MAG: hypothetical protein JWO94_259 [Verrucomicrobiaceae bacterium]|nr:hypothetical protein [Verrucomicrobiaceae bacterium]
MWTQPHPSAHATPGQRARDVGDVAGHAQTMTTRMGDYQPRIIGTFQGKLWHVLALPAGNSLTVDWPATMHAPHSLPQPAQLARQADDLDYLATAYPVRLISDIEGQPQIYAQAQFVGYTEAVPLVLHDDGESWLVTGGVLSQVQGPEGSTPVDFTLPTTHFTRDTGIIGIQFGLLPGTTQVTKAEWRVQTLGSSGFAAPTTTAFCPVWVVNGVSGRVASLVLQLPFERHGRCLTFTGTFATGTVLSS